MTTLALEDVQVRDTTGRESDGEIGRGLGIQYGTSVTAAPSVTT